MLVAMVGLTVASSTTAGKTRLHLGLVTPPGGKLGYPSVAAASTWAVSDAQDQGLLTDYDVR